MIHMRMNTVLNPRECCRICLKAECPFTSLVTLDTDNIKLNEKLSSCVSEINWLREGVPQLICSSCVGKLRIAYNFRTLCLETEGIFHQNELKHPTVQQFCDDPLKLESSNTKILPYNSRSTGKAFQDEASDIRQLKLSVKEVLPFSTTTVLNPLKHATSDILITKHDANKMQNPEFLELNMINDGSNYLKLTQTQPLLGKLIPTPSEIKVEPTQIKQEMVVDNHIKINCEICGEESARNVDTFTEEKSYRCDSCKKKKHTGEKRFHCTVCSMKFWYKAKLTEHMPTHAGEKPYACTYCDEKFRKESNLELHIQLHTGRKTSTSSDKKHTQIKSPIALDNNTKFNCEICEKECIRNVNLKIPTTHAEKKTYKCKDCEDKLADLSQASDSNDRFPCTLCSKNFMYEADLTEHMQTHTGEKLYVCTYCDEKFKQESNLQLHIQSHTDEKSCLSASCDSAIKFICEICGKEYATKTNLKIHKSCHTGKKPYKCKYCEKRFSHSTMLINHTRTHVGEKRFHCTLCSKLFRYQSSLTEHMRSHTGEKPYICTFCDKGFKNASNLRVHLRLHTGEKPFTCTHCDENFGRKDSLRYHLTSHMDERR